MAERNIALPGLDDARHLTGLDTPEGIADFYLNLDASTGALTIGADGTLVATAEARRRIPVRTVRVVDRTAAGDTFDGAFLARLVTGDSPCVGAEYVSAAASLSKMGYGASIYVRVRRMKHAVIIGGTRGIGAGVADSLMQQGWRVTATGVAEAEVTEFQRQHPEVAASKLDVRKTEDVQAFFEGLSTLDGLVNCAGILSRGEEYDIETFERVIDINLTGTMRTCVAAHDLLADGGGAIVNTASMLSYFGGPLVPAYSASKGGVAQLTKALAGGWAKDGIRVNAVAPGWIETEMTEALRADPARNEPILARTPQRRWGKPSDVGALMAWLLSEDAGFITGALYPVDGGYSAM